MTPSQTAFVALCFIGLICAPQIVSARTGDFQINANLPKPKRQELCNTCITFMNNAIDVLLNVILNGGVLGSCAALCSNLENSLEATVCNLLCDYVGIETFIYILDEADPDSLFYCMELRVCPINDKAAGKITNVEITPPSGATGTTFNFEADFQIINATGTGMFEIAVIPPSDLGEPLASAQLLIDTPPGPYHISAQLQTDPTESDSFAPGVYKVVFALCEGTCGGTHSHEYTMDQKQSSFKITA